ncbi:propanediol utilization protein [Rhodovulum sp. 12E13]|uniref:propanediol utilization protein n=1 Tax=Rhodovulum sp. 12E13 TaxID=2203891 RepID=UPI000E13F9BA|nr:propanediol utilization protein [Rhodovulum sp. 12E13]RDC72626.1 propanediol utilization protein [Rhodovulum sp. 12E13]
MVFVAGHFGEWLQGRLGPGGPVALVTLACPVRGVRATLETGAPPGLDRPDGLLDACRARRFLAALGRPLPGRVRLAADLPPGGGAGMSTAALVALARLLGAEEERVAAACLSAEGATDPLMRAAPDAVLWAPRRAVALRALPRPPVAEIVGGFLGRPEPTDPADTRFPDIADLAEDWAATLAPDRLRLPARLRDAPGRRQAQDHRGGGDAGTISADRLARLARIASASALRTTALRGPGNDPTAALAARLGALGHARAHTGSARALIFPPGGVPAGAEAALRGAGYACVLRFRTGAT